MNENEKSYTPFYTNLCFRTPWSFEHIATHENRKDHLSFIRPFDRTLVEWSISTSNKFNRSLLNTGIKREVDATSDQHLVTRKSH